MLGPRGTASPRKAMGEMAKKDSRFSFARSIQVFQENVNRAGPAASASYSLIGAIVVLGGAGLRGRSLAGFGAVGCVRRPSARLRRRVLRVSEGGSESMKPVAWMVAASAAAWLLVTATLADRANPEAALGDRRTADGRLGELGRVCPGA